MQTDIEKMDWIFEGIRDSLETIKAAQEESEWDTVAEAEESWE